MKMVFYKYALKVPATELTVIGGKVDCAMFDLVRLFSASLEKLNLIQCLEWSMKGVEGLASLPKLEVVNVELENIISADTQILGCISGFHQLRSVNFNAADDLTDDCVKRFLSKCLQLENIAITCESLVEIHDIDGEIEEASPITGAAFDHIDQLSNLKNVYFYDFDNVTAHTLETLSKCKTLTSVSLPFCEVQDCAALLSLPNLQKVELCGYEEDGDLAAEHLSNCLHLTHVAESGRLGRAELLAKGGSIGQMQTPAELKKKCGYALGS